VIRCTPLFTVFVMWLSLMMALAGCTAGRIPVADTPVSAADGEALLAMWLERREAFQSLEGLAKVRVKTAQGSVSGTQVVVAAKPANLRAETLSPFGLPLLSLASDSHLLAVLVPGDNLYYQGEATPENLTRFTHLPLPPTALVDILLWQPPLVAFEELTTFRTAGGGWRLLLVAGPLRQELTFDAAERLQGVRYFSGDKLQLLVDYADFADSDLPHRISLEQPPIALQASLDFNELTVNPSLPVGRFSLQPPPGSQVIFLDELDAGKHPSESSAPVPGRKE